VTDTTAHARNPLVSVIIPVYNRGPMIRYALESVRRASAGLEVETIVVDDGSTDGSREYLRSVRYPRAQPHTGGPRTYHLHPG